jgi:hypothetical protein
MDPNRHHALASSLAVAGSRRHALTASLASVLGFLGLARPVPTFAAGKCKPTCGECQRCKKGTCHKTKHGKKRCKKGTCQAKSDGTGCSIGTCQGGTCATGVVVQTFSPGTSSFTAPQAGTVTLDAFGARGGSGAIGGVGGPGEFLLAGQLAPPATAVG